MKQFNLNDYIKVKLNEEGIAILKREFDKAGLPFENQVDENGYTDMQAWRFIQTFGPHLNMAFESPFDINILISEEYLYDLSQGKKL